MAQVRCSEYRTGCKNLVELPPKRKTIRCPACKAMSKRNVNARKKNPIGNEDSEAGRREEIHRGRTTGLSTMLRGY